MAEEKKKRGRGRPPGSRNKPKLGEPKLGVSSKLIALAASPEIPTAAPLGTLAYHEAQLARLQQKYDQLTALPLALPRDYSMLDAGISRHLRAIAELKGETKITELKILKSEAWLALWFRIERALERHPEALADVLSAIDDGSPEDIGGARDARAQQGAGAP